MGEHRLQFGPPPELDLGTTNETITAVRPPRFNVSGGVCIDVDDDGETHMVGSERMHCMKCGRHRHHDLYLIVEGDSVISCIPLRKCRDCGLELVGRTSRVGSASARARGLEFNGVAR